MKLKVFAAWLFLTMVVTSNAQVIKPYEWEKNRERYTLSATEQTQPELLLKQHFQYDYTLEDNQFLMYSTIHRIAWVNNNEAIQKHNRIVISMTNAIDLVELKARVINKDGKVVLFDKSNLKEMKEGESGNAYRIFAMEGVELGSEIEYYFIRKMRGSIYDRAYMQYDVPVKASSFVLTCPKHLKFDFKAYQGFPSVKDESVAGAETNVYKGSMKDTPAMKKEPFSYFDANRMRIEFKLAFNTARSQARLYTWDEAGKTFYSVLTELSKDDEKAVDKFVKSLGDNPSQKTDTRIKTIEQKIKTAIQVNRESGDNALSKIESVLKYKVASREGITKLFMTTFMKAGIKCQPVITCNRENMKFDGSFDSWSYLDEYLLYFPETKQFMAPYFFETRYPLIPANLTSQQGLFMEPFSVGELKSALASIENIPALDYSISNDDLTIDVGFSEDLSSVNVKQKREFGGYNAMYFVPYYDMMTKEQRSNMVDELTKQTAPDATIKNWTATLLPERATTNFLLDVDFQSSHFIEKAGPRILFKAGELIGPQTEMYRDDQRITGVENDFNRGYDRTIKIQVPAGYTIKNPQDLKIDIEYKDKDKVPFLFKSDYTLKGDILEITIQEDYKEIYAPLARYEDFRKVINAAADFNKVTLVLEKAK